MKKLSIFGASGHAKAVHEIARLRDWDVAAFVETNPDKSAFRGAPLISEDAALRDPPGETAIVAVRNPQTRRRVTNRLRDRGIKIATLVHPKAVVSDDVVLAEGAVVMASAVVNAGVHVGAGAIVNSNCTVEHDCVLDDFSHVCPGAALGGNVRVGTGTWIGINATVLESVSIGEWTMIGGGAVVVRDIPSRVVAYGVPATVRREKEYFEPDQLAPSAAAANTPPNTVKASNSDVRSVVASVVNKILSDTGRDIQEFAEEDQLMGSIGLDSLDLAVMTVSLEQNLGVDPFRDGRGAVRSFGELVSVYKEVLGTHS